MAWLAGVSYGMQIGISGPLCLLHIGTDRHHIGGAEYGRWLDLCHDVLHTEKGSCRFVEVEVAFSPETNGDHCRGGLLPLEMEGT